MADAVFPWVWVGCLLFFIISFAIIEGIALKRGATTLSLFTYRVTAAFPLMIFLLGMLAGGLAVHFWWHFCPAGSISGG